jgi:CHAD domain-containing protein
MVEIERRRGRSITTRTTPMPRSRSIARAKAEPAVSRADVSRADVSNDPPPLKNDGATSDPAPQRYRFTPPTLDPATPARAASTILLASLGDAVRATVEQIVRGDEPEAVHDLRLALRRTRCLLGPLRGVFTRTEAARLRTGLRWLGELSGPPRDLELLVERLEATREELPEPDREAIAVLLSMVCRDRDQARRALLKGLASARYGRLGDAWARLASSFLRPSRENGSTRLPRQRPAAPAADQPIATVAAEAIVRAWRRLLRHGKKLSDSSAAEDFHEVRIDGKKLRYLLELFRSVYPAVDLAPTIENLKSLQNCLGDFNDAQVQEELLREMAPRLATADGATAESLLLVGRLIERSHRARRSARRRFEDRFSTLAAKDNRRRIRSLAGH